jgi:hypothetical protein
MRKLKSSEYAICAWVIAGGMCVSTLIVVFAADEQSDPCQTKKQLLQCELYTWLVGYTALDITLLLASMTVFVCSKPHFRFIQLCVYIVEGVAWIFLFISVGLSGGACRTKGMWAIGVVQLGIYWFALLVEIFCVEFEESASVKFTSLV